MKYNLLFSLWFTLLKITFVAIAWCRKSLNTQVWTIYHCYIYKIGWSFKWKKSISLCTGKQSKYFRFFFFLHYSTKYIFGQRVRELPTYYFQIDTQRSEENHEYIKWLDYRRSKWRVQSEHNRLHRGEPWWVKHGKIDFYFYNHYCRSPPYQLWDTCASDNHLFIIPRCWDPWKPCNLYCHSQ